MQKQYGTLALLEEIQASNGADAHDLVIFRPTCKEMADIIEGAARGGNSDQINRFVKTCVRALNGGTEPLEFSAGRLNSSDGGELSAVLQSMWAEADAVQLPEDTGDGISAPLFYNLRYPIKMTPRDDAETLTQFSFQARRIREISEFLDARSEIDQFRAFMRGFGTPIGITPAIMSDVLIDSLDFVDYLAIRGPLVMGKFHDRARAVEKNVLTLALNHNWPPDSWAAMTIDQLCRIIDRALEMDEERRSQTETTTSEEP